MIATNEQGIQDRGSELKVQQWPGSDSSPRTEVQHLGEKEEESCSQDQRGRKTDGRKRDNVAEEENKNFSTLFLTAEITQTLWCL